MIFIYRFFYFILKTILLASGPLLSPSFRAWIHLRKKSLPEKKGTETESYWFHASSGEVEYCKAAVRILREEEPRSRIVITYSSPSAEKLFHNISPFADVILPLPWDQPRALNRLIDFINPKILVFSRTDLWPELIHQAKKRKIPTGIISFYPRLYFLNRLFYRYLLSGFSFISCVDYEQAQALLKLVHGTRVTADGDTRFDQVFFRLEQEPKLILNCSDKVLTCGSTWPEDEKVLLPYLQEIRKSGIHIVLSPHEVAADNIARVRSQLAAAGLSSQLLSAQPDLKNITFGFDVLLIDKIGYLADCYRFSDIAFVGGSFREKIHSVMEPLCCGIHVLCGPFYANNPEAVRFNRRFVHPVSPDAQFAEAVKKYISRDKEEILEQMQQSRTASKKVTAIILNRPLKT